MSSDGRPERPQESKIALTDRLRREGRWEAATLFKDAVFEELRSAGIRGQQAKDTAWAEMARRFPPLPPPVAPKKEEKPPEALEEVVEEEGVEEMSEEEADAVERMLETLAPVDLFADIRWVYSQLENKRVRPDQAPSAGAWSLLQWARKYQSRFFEQLLPKALAKGPEDTDGVKRDRRRVEEIEAIIMKLSRKEP